MANHHRHITIATEVLVAGFFTLGISLPIVYFLTSMYKAFTSAGEAPLTEEFFVAHEQDTDASGETTDFYQRHSQEY